MSANRESQPSSKPEIRLSTEVSRGFNAEVALRNAVKEITSLRELLAVMAGASRDPEGTRRLVEQQYLDSAGLPTSPQTGNLREAGNTSPLQSSLRTLGLAPDILDGLTEEQIQLVLKSGFRIASQIHHPDHGGDISRFRDAKAAYDFLKEPSNRLPK